MKTFREWMQSMRENAGIVSGTFMNGPSFNEKGARNKNWSDEASPLPGPYNADPDEMYLGKRRPRSKNRRGRAK